MNQSNTLPTGSMIGYKKVCGINPNTPPQTLNELSKDSDYSIRLAVAGNVNTPLQVLMRLAQDSQENVVEEVKSNPSTPEGAKIWLTSGGFAGMSLEDFMESVNG